MQQEMETYSKFLKHCQIELTEAMTDQEKQGIRKAMACCRRAIADAFERETVLLTEARNGEQFTKGDRP